MAAKQLTPEELELRRQKASQRNRARYALNKESVLEKKRIWYALNKKRPPRIKAPKQLDAEELERRRLNDNTWHRAWYARNKEKVNKKAKAWRTRNPDKVREHAKAYRQDEANRERERKQKEDRRRADPAAWRERAAEYYQQNRIRLLVGQAKARAKAKGLPFDGVPELIATRPANCLSCGVELDYRHRGRSASPQSPTLDRLINALGYVSGNVFIICHRCNAVKNTASLDELEKIVAYMRKNAPKAVPV